MNELQIEVKQQTGSISTNFEEIEKALKAELANYTGIVIADESEVKAAKDDLAELRKKRTAIESKKREVKKLWDEPYAEFEKKCKQLIALVDETIEPISKQIKEFDNKRIEEKYQHLNQLYLENIDDLGEYIPFETTLSDKWSNVSFKDKDYLYDLSEKKLHIKTDIEAIKALSSEIEDEVLATYKRTGNNLSSAIMRNNQYVADKNRVKEQVKEEVKEEVKAETVVENVEPVIEEIPEIVEAVDLTTVSENKNAEVMFIVPQEKAEQVEQFLLFSDIPF